MRDTLIVTSTRKSAELLIKLLQESGRKTEQMQAAFSAGEARRALLEHTYTLVLINSPLSDEFGSDLAAFAADQRDCAVVMLVKNELADSVAEQLEPDGIFVLEKPLSRPLFHQIIRIAAATRLHILTLQQENRKLHQKLDDMRVISRAKCLLIQELHMTEAEAHSYIEKHAMNHRRTRREVSEMIIQNYE